MGRSANRQKEREEERTARRMIQRHRRFMADMDRLGLSNMREFEKLIDFRPPAYSYHLTKTAPLTESEKSELSKVDDSRRKEKTRENTISGNNIDGQRHGNEAEEKALSSPVEGFGEDAGEKEAESGGKKEREG